MKLSRNQIKYLAVVTMVIDHIAWAFVPTYTVLGQVLHFIGRLTGPIMAYMVAEGYIHTKDLKKYMIRMGVFAFVSWVPYSLFEYGRWLAQYFSIISTFFLALTALWVWDKSAFDKPSKIISIVVLCIVSIPCDWGVMGILWPLYFYIYRNDEKRKWKSFVIIASVEVLTSQLYALTTDEPFRQVFQFGVFMAIPILSCLYSGTQGSRHPFHKWFFYIFYPLHLIILFLIKQCI